MTDGQKEKRTWSTYICDWPSYKNYIDFLYGLILKFG